MATCLLAKIEKKRPKKKKRKENNFNFFLIKKRAENGTILKKTFKDLI